MGRSRVASRSDHSPYSPAVSSRTTTASARRSTASRGAAATSSGPEVEAFEEEFARYLGVRHCVGVANGTDALTIALRALGVGPGRRGGDAVLHLLRHRRGGTRARRAAGVLRHRPGHLLRHARHRRARRSPRAPRRSCRWTCSATSRRSRRCASSGCRWWRTPRRPPAPRSTGPERGRARRHRHVLLLPLEEPALPGRRRRHRTDDDELAEHARILRFHGSKDKVTFTDVGYNSRLDELQAAALRVLLPELDGWTERRQAAAAAYERLGMGEHVVAAAATDGRRARLPPLRRALRARAAGRPRLLPHAGAPPAGVGSDVELPATEEAARTNFALPMGTDLTEDQVRQVVEECASGST